MRLLIVDDHEVVRRGVRSLLSDQTSYDLCGEAVDGQDALDKARELKPDLIVMDVSMPRLNGLDATRQLRAILPDSEVLILSQHEHSEMARQALKAGARGYVVKSSISKDLIAALQKVSRREYFFDPAILDNSSSTHLDPQEILQRSNAFETALRQSEERLRNLVEYLSAVMNNMAEGLYALDEHGLLTSINPAGEAILGWTKDELLGKKMHDVTHYRRPDGSSFPASECPGLQVLQNGTALREHEETFIRKDGSFVPVVFSASPLKDNGKIAGVIVSFRDDAEQRRAREALLHAKRELEVSGEHLQLVTKSMAASVTRCSKDLRYLWANQGYADWLQRPLEQIIGQQIVDVLGNDGFKKLLPCFKRVLSGQRVVYEEEVMFASIGPRWISAVYTPTLDAAGTPDGWVAAVVDVTDRRRSEEDLRHSREQLVLALKSSKSAMFDWDVIHRRGNWNPQMAAIYVFQPKSQYITGEEWVTLFHPEDVERLRQEAERLWEKGDEFYCEFRTAPRDGTVKWISSNGHILRDGNGKAVRLIGTHTDITDRKRAEEVMKKSEAAAALLVSVVSSSDDAIVSKTLDGIITSWNKAAEELFGYSSAEAYGQHITLIVPPDRRSEEADIMLRLSRGEKVDHFETVRQRKDGRLVEVSITVSPVKDSQGRVIGASNVSRDITAKRQSERALATRARQQRALFHLSDELHRARSMDDVFKAALNAILGALQCNRASILLCDDAGIMHFTSWRGLSSEYRASTDGHSAWRADEKNPQPVCINDIHVADLRETLKAVLKKEGIGSLAFIPLVSNATLTGQFMAYFNTPHEFTLDEIDLSLTIARQLSFAIDRRRNDEALEHSRVQLAKGAESLWKLSECSSRLWQMRNLRKGLEEMLDAIIELLGADKGNVQLLDRERRVLTIEVQRGFEKEFLDFFREVSAEDDSACGRALRTGERMVIGDVEQDSPFAPLREVARTAGFRAVTSIPLMGNGNLPLGVLSTHFRLPHRPSDQELGRLDLYARQAANFIERCRTEEVLRENEERLRKISETLDEEVRARTKELEDKNADLSRQAEQVRELAHDLLRAQDEERRHIARELHDSAGQTLAVIGMSLDQTVQEAARVAPPVAKRLEEVQSIVQQLNREIRTTSYLLHPPLLEESGLSSALNWFVQGFGERSGIAVTLAVAGSLGRLPNNVELAIFRLVQECLTNIHRHSGSKTAFIRAEIAEQTIQIEIADQGKGISPERLRAIQSGGSGVGIRGMHERLRQFGGEMSVEASSSGTRVMARIPLSRSAVGDNETVQVAV